MKKLICLYNIEDLYAFREQLSPFTNLDEHDEEGSQNATQDLDVNSLLECARKLIDALVTFQAN